MSRLQMKIKPQVIQGMKLGTLLKVLANNKFQVDRDCYGRLAYLLVLGVFNSIYGACETIFNSREIEATEIQKPPIFIIGHWRSGTTHLHNLLNVDENLCCPTAYQALFPHHFVFSQAGGIVFNLLAPRKRPMDNVAFGANVPHEDEFGIAAHTGISPYMRIWFPETGENAETVLDPQKLPPAALEQWKQSLVLFLKKMTLSEGKQVVLKSPPHFGRVGTLLEMFPEAKFIHIVRHPYMVYASTHHLWRSSLAFAHLQKTTPELIDELILDWYSELFKLYERDRTGIPESSLVEIRYEDLEVRPIEVLENIYTKLDIGGFQDFRVRAEQYLASISNYKKNEHRLSDADCAKVRARWGDTLGKYGYSEEI